MADELDYEVTEEEPEEEALTGPKYEIFSYPADTTLKGYLEQWDKDQLTIPTFQRDFVWDQTRASKLIESFLLGLPVPPVFLYKPAGTKSFWIIDGQQRIRSIVAFQKGLFREAKFRLKGVDQRWIGKSFDELTDDEKFSFETNVLRAVVIQQTQPKDHSSIYHIFERLNTGGIRLSAMEVRQCVYASDFLSRLKTLNELNSWRKILGLSGADKRLKDRELILRIFALYNDLKHYDKPMKRFLNDCAIHFQLTEEKNLKDYKNEIEDISNKFTAACDQIFAALGPKPFHLRNRLNFGALDAVVVTVMKLDKVDGLKDKYAALLKDGDFEKDVSFNTSDESVVKGRFAAAHKYLAS